jgi:hypothetical protein
VAARGVDAELGDRLGADRANEFVQVRGDGVQRAGDAVVVEEVGVDAEDVLNGPLLGPPGHFEQRHRRGQAVGDQRLDDLPVSEVGDIAHRAQLVDDAGDVQPAQEMRTGRQRPQPLLHHRGDQKLSSGTPHTGTVATDEDRHATFNAPTPARTPPTAANRHNESCAKDRTSHRFPGHLGGPGGRRRPFATQQADQGQASGVRVGAQGARICETDRIVVHACKASFLKLPLQVFL